jgi:hypothetical protein
LLGCYVQQSGNERSSELTAEHIRQSHDASESNEIGGWWQSQSRRMCHTAADFLCTPSRRRTPHFLEDYKKYYGVWFHCFRSRARYRVSVMTAQKALWLHSAARFLYFIFRGYIKTVVQITVSHRKDAYQTTKLTKRSIFVEIK